jgi:hypothetical protein
LIRYSFIELTDTTTASGIYLEQDSNGTEIRDCTVAHTAGKAIDDQHKADTEDNTYTSVIHNNFAHHVSSSPVYVTRNLGLGNLDLNGVNLLDGTPTLFSNTYVQNPVYETP